ncbi:hypothetical protein BGZ57DRAFT_857090 [Hyaloscypha finlandica]|nr:hypothetical protein BGZ57DRAFT_857090 [Hyaloscypha finlandica]KAH8789106.1 hypothetical protein F5882DRAFT_377964 [Hyaloscypha sp. PMI_1271]
MVLLFLYFAFLSICRSATFDTTGTQSIMEFINSDLDSELVQIANETPLFEVLVQNGPSELGRGSSGCDANNAKLPGLDRRQYVENDEDQKCGADHNFVQLGTQLYMNAWGSHCNGDGVSNRHITCRIWSPDFMVDPTDTWQSP